MRLIRTETVFESAKARAVPDDLVTVIVSLYNYADFLPECLNSLALQKHPHLDLVVVDDRSTKDDSVAVARDWLVANAERFGRVLLLQHTRNQGLAETRNTGFEQARGELVFVIDADNTIYPRAIARLVETMRSGSFAAAYTQLELFGHEQGLGQADIWHLEWFKSGNYVDAMALVSKKAWERVGGYTHVEGGWEDYDFWCKFFENGLSAAYVPEVLCRYRVHPSSMLRTETKTSYRSIYTEMTMRHPWLQIRL